MKRDKAIRKIDEVLSSLGFVYSDKSLYKSLLDDLMVYVTILISVNDIYPWELTIHVQEICDDFEKNISVLSDEDYDIYCINIDVLGILYSCLE